LDNKPLYLEVAETKLGTYMAMDNKEELVILLLVSVNDGLWNMQFDGARSRFRSGAGVVLTTHLVMVFPVSFHL